MRILVHETNSLLSNLLSHFLHQNDYSTRTTDGSYDELKQSVLSFNPDIVILGNSSYHNGPFGLYLNLKEHLSKISLKPKFMLILKNEDPLAIQTAYDMGISGLIHENDGLVSIIKCTQEISKSNQYTSPSIESTLEFLRKNLYSCLTSTEREIIKLIVQGNDTRRISKLLFRSEDTIKSHRKSIKYKFGIRGGKKTFLAYISSMLVSKSEN